MESKELVDPARAGRRGRSEAGAGAGARIERVLAAVGVREDCGVQGAAVEAALNGHGLARRDQCGILAGRTRIDQRLAARVSER